MADTVGTTPQIPLIVPDKHTENRQKHGLPTPKGTPGPDLGRNVADQARQATEMASPSNAKQAQPENLETQSKKDITEEQEDEESEEDKPPTEAQITMVEEIIKHKPKDHSGILGLKKKESDYQNQTEMNADILRAFIERSALTHPAYNKHEKSDKAHRLVMDAAKAMGVSAANRDAMRDWDGEPIEEGLTLSKGRWEHSDGDVPMTNSSPSKNPHAQPNEFYQQIYKEAEPHLQKLIGNPGDSEALAEVEKLNKKISDHNEQQKLSQANWKDGTIEHHTIRGHVSTIRQIREALMQNPADTEARQNLDEGIDMMKKYIKQHGYPSTWVLDDPVPATSQAQNQPPVASDETKKAAPEVPVVQGIKYPWTTGLTAAGEPIIAYRPVTKFGTISGHRCVVEEKGPKGTPKYVFRNGAAIGQLELDKYLKQSEIKRLAETDAEGRRKKVWSYRDKGNFQELLWAAVAPLSRATLGKGRRDPETLCCVKFDWGMELLSRSNLKSVIGEKSTNTRIARDCEERGVLPPWKVEPDILCVPQKEKAGFKDSVAGSSEVKSINDRFAAMEERMESLQTSNTNENSLTAMLAKFEKRMESMEEKLSKIDQVEKSAKSLTELVADLMARVKKVEEKSS